MTRYFVVCLALMLGGCLEIAAPTPIAAPGPRPVEHVYVKLGASPEEFQRTRARCLMNANMATDQHANPTDWTSVFRSCMRADGWVSVPKH